MPSGSEGTSADDLNAYWLGFDDKATMILRKGLRFLLNLRTRYR